jgi:hypothetical protein
MEIKKKIPCNLLTLAKNFHKNPLYELQLIRQKETMPQTIKLLITF